MLGAFGCEPLLRFGGAEMEDGDDRDRRENRGADHRQQRPVGELVEGGVDRDRDEIAGDEPPQVEIEIARRLARLALGKLVRDGGEDGERRAVHDRGAEAAHQPGAGAVIGEEDQIDDVLDDREAGADREAGDDRVELVADAVEAEEADRSRSP